MDPEKRMRRLWAAAMLLCSVGGLGTALASHLAAPDWAVRLLGICAIAGIGLVSFTTVRLMRKKKLAGLS